jgi:alpha-beta hydrolase superfamily lysophospholipase
MNEENLLIPSAQGARLNVIHWPVPNANHVLCIVHGLAEHAGRYQGMARHLSAAGIAVLAVDLRGHGQSTGKRGHTRRYAHLLDDVEELLKAARAEYTDAKLALLGHSMGGNLVANFVTARSTTELTAFILSSPWLRLAFDPPTWKLTLARWMNHVLPGLTQNNELDPTLISRDPAEVAAYTNDPLNHTRISVRMYNEIVKHGEQALAAKAPALPGLIYHGTGDQITSHTASHELSQKWNTQWLALEGSYHETHYDLEREKVYGTITGFILKN